MRSKGKDRDALSVSQSGVGDRVSAAAPFGYALLSPPLARRSGKGRCAALPRRGRAWRFRGLLAFSLGRAIVLRV